MIDKLSYYYLRPDAPRDMRIFGDSSSGTENNIIPHDQLAFGVENFTGIQPGLQNPSLVSSYEGSIDRILFCFPSRRSNEQVAVYKSLIKELGSDTKLIIAYNNEMRADIESWLTSVNHPLDKVEWAPISDYVGLTHWAEDAYVALKDAADNQNYLMEPWSFLRGGDQLIADAVSDYTDIQSSQAPLKFQGGNCLIGDDFWILGADYFETTKKMISDGDLPLYPEANQNIEALIHANYKEYIDDTRKLYLTGTSSPIPLKYYTASISNGQYFIDIAAKGVGDYQPIFHIDMFITLLGRNGENKFEIMVADPALGNQLAGLQNEPVNLQETYNKIANDFINAGFIVHRNPIIHHAAEFEGRHSVSQLENSGNAPLIDLAQELRALGAQDTDKPKVRDWHHITWNNCLIENSAQKGKHVYMPTFGHGPMGHLAVVDDAMETQFMDLGYTVHRLADCNKLAESMGVVHCISKYIDRGN